MTESKKDTFARMYGKNCTHAVTESQVKEHLYRGSGVSMANLLSQQMRAAEWHKEDHERLIAAGWEWDGMDGYTAPSQSVTGRSPSHPETQSLTGSLQLPKDPLRRIPEVDYLPLEKRIAQYLGLNWDGKPVSK